VKQISGEGRVRGRRNGWKMVSFKCDMVIFGVTGCELEVEVWAMDSHRNATTYSQGLEDAAVARNNQDGDNERRLPSMPRQTCEKHMLRTRQT
jgi:hypothetical protein